MYIPKQYGKSRVDSCPFCNKRAITENSQGLPVCKEHKQNNLELKCFCGSWLDIRKGKWGPFCTCIKCGVLSFNKAMAINEGKIDVKSMNDSTPTNSENKTEKQKKARPAYKAIKEDKKEIVMTSDELDFYE
jgi:hypothetical protein